MNKIYEIGQVVFVVPDQAQHILPGIIVEEVIVRKITGNSTSWKIKIGSPEKAKVLDSEKVNGEVYGSLEEVRVVISNKLSDYLNKVTSDAEGLVEKWYGKDIAEKQKNLSRLTKPLESDSDDPDLLLSSLDSGPSIPQQQINAAVKKQVSGPEDARERLRRLAIDEEVPMAGSEDEQKVFIQQPDGQRVAVTIPKI